MKMYIIISGAFQVDFIFGLNCLHPARLFALTQIITERKQKLTHLGQRTLISEHLGPIFIIGL